MRLVALLTLVLALILPPPALAQTGEVEGREIRAVILDQLDAFQAGDMARAFAHASPSIQAKFGDPANFRRMVETGYPMVWRPDRFEVGALGERGGRPVQTMLFTDAAGRLYEADYEMIRVDGAWRINGVTVRALPGLSS